MKTVLILSVIFIFSNSLPAQLNILPKAATKTLATKFKSWKIADIDPTIVEYFKTDRPNELPNLLSGDWNGDRQTDFAVLLQHKMDSDRQRIIVVFIKAKADFQNFILEGNDCLMLAKKGGTDYDFESQKKFVYRNDAIFSYIWEKAGTSYVWEKNRFRRVATSD